jgi:membrane protein implicated in regulation of membrane protease activity
MKFLKHSLVLVASFGLIFLWEQGPFSGFTIQLLALMVVAYGAIQFFRRRSQEYVMEGIFDVFTLNTGIFLLIYATGQMQSWFFFLLYFLGFGITFIFEPATVFLFALGTIAIFIPDVITNGGSIGTYIQLGSFLLISPLPFFFGKEYREREKEEEVIEALEERSQEAGITIAKDVSEVLKNEKQNLKQEDVEKLNEILEESEDLRSEIQS